MSSFTITKVHAKPHLSVLISRGFGVGKTIPVTQLWQPIWPPGNPNPAAPDQSNLPLAIPVAIPTEAYLNLMVQFDYTISSDLYSTMVDPEYFLSAHIEAPNARGPIFKSNTAPLKQTGASVAVFWSFSPAYPVNSPVPLRIAGDFRWSLYVASHDTTPVRILSNNTTRLEIYCTPNDPMPIFDAAHPVELLRHVIPNYFEFTLQNTRSWLADRTFNQIWDYGNTNTPIEYDKGGYGASHFRMRSEGNIGASADQSFPLELWLTKAKIKCNCYDLAGIAQTSLACFGLSSVTGQPAVPATWIRAESFGYIPNSILYGFFGREFTNLPFTPKQVYDQADLGAHDRSYFTRHVWIEAVLGSTQTVDDSKVFDLTVAGTGGNANGPAEFHSGRETRNEYLISAIDQSGHRSLQFTADRLIYDADQGCRFANW